MPQHRMTHISVHGVGIDSDAFRDTVDRHLESMSMSGWELVSTQVNEVASGNFKPTTAVDALLFWKKPD